MMKSFISLALFFYGAAILLVSPALYSYYKIHSNLVALLLFLIVPLTPIVSWFLLYNYGQTKSLSNLLVEMIVLTITTVITSYTYGFILHRFVDNQTYGLIVVHLFLFFIVVGMIFFIPWIPE